jgi:hypothetical protein
MSAAVGRPGVNDHRFWPERAIPRCPRRQCTLHAASSKSKASALIESACQCLSQDPAVGRMRWRRGCHIFITVIRQKTANSPRQNGPNWPPFVRTPEPPLALNSAWLRSPSEQFVENREIGIEIRGFQTVGDAAGMQFGFKSLQIHSSQFGHQTA